MQEDGILVDLQEQFQILRDETLAGADIQSQLGTDTPVGDYIASVEMRLAAMHRILRVIVHETIVPKYRPDTQNTP